MQGRGTEFSRVQTGKRAQPAFRTVVGRCNPAPPLRLDNQPAAVDPVAALNSVLSEAPVDLCRIADEMRLLPEFETIVMRLASSLLLAPEDSVGTIEEAVVALGTDRLRSVLHIWSLFRKRHTTDNTSNQGGPDPSRAPANDPTLRSTGTLHPETLYLATFLRYLGWGTEVPPIASPCASADRTGEFFELTNIFRDCMSLVPMIGDELHMREPIGSGALSGSEGKGAE
jgi:hypothetical protein